MANKKRTLKRRKIRGGFFGNEDQTKDSIKDPKEDEVRSPEGVSQTPEPHQTVVSQLANFFGFGSKPQPPSTVNPPNQLGGKRKTNKRKTKRNRSQKR
jgi:hypothetical protein